MVTNNMTYKFYLDRLTELSISMFDWKNVPKSIDVRFLEATLFINGSAVFFLDKDLESDTGLSDTRTEEGTYLALPVATNGKWNVYNVPTQRRAYATSGYQKQLDTNDSVMIYNNMIRTNAVQTCTLYAKRLWNLDRIIDVNANAQKTPVLIVCDEQQRLTALNTYQQWDGNEPVIFASKDLDLGTLKALRTDAPYVADKLYQLKTEIWNEALTYLGISNINYQKGHAIFEATHGIAPDIAGKNIVNPCSIILSAVMMLQYIGWGEAGTQIEQAMEKLFAEGIATADLARFMPNGKALGTKEFGEALAEAI